ncbi:hypothetical protein P154DRAFT_298233 [Amniculicola lignicola CBS 123094]|uniref:Rhodopsin domain-containing protein n=1 Tax=Amniculicola lignicola CBS 123094 TaxID=1392246 RepID=A0A6A5W7I0_9PLEO|nr:hypothetical protein P154DRAFT_298233 [Amniculicola lignicola CBS 123094]
MPIPTPSPATIIATITAILLLSIFAVFLRFYILRRRSQRWRTDDWLTLPCLVLLVGLVVLLFYGLATKALGYPASTLASLLGDQAGKVAEWKSVTARKIGFTALLISTGTAGLIRVSILLLYRRTVGKDRPWSDTRNMFIFLMMSLAILWAIIYTFTFMFMCKGKFHVLFYGASLPRNTCLDIFAVTRSASLQDLILNVLVIAIPVPFVLKQAGSRPRTLLVISAFVAGFAAVSASAIRMLCMIWIYKHGFALGTEEQLLITVETYTRTMEIMLGLLAGTLAALVEFISADEVLRTCQNTPQDTHAQGDQRRKDSSRDPSPG